MVTPAAGAVVLVPFPFSDPRAIPLSDGDFDSGSLLRRASYARPGKLFTANQNLLVVQVGNLKEESFRRIITAIVSLLQVG